MTQTLEARTEKEAKVVRTREDLASVEVGEKIMIICGRRKNNKELLVKKGENKFTTLHRGQIPAIINSFYSFNEEGNVKMPTNVYIWPRSYGLLCGRYYSSDNTKLRAAGL